MSKPDSSDLKDRSLKEQGSLNPRPQDVVDPLFGDDPFFDPRDLVQVKYEMLRRVRADGQTVSQSAAAHGLSRPSYYQAKSAFESNGIVGLVPRKPGPRQAHKLTPEVMSFVEDLLDEDSTLRAPALAQYVEESFGFSIHPRSIERALERRKKKRP